MSHRIGLDWTDHRVGFWSPGRGQTSLQDSNAQEPSSAPTDPVQRYNEFVPSVQTTWDLGDSVLKVVFVYNYALYLSVKAQ